jgi:hypothetical protein
VLHCCIQLLSARLHLQAKILQDLSAKLSVLGAEAWLFREGGLAGGRLHLRLFEQSEEVLRGMVTGGFYGRLCRKIIAGWCTY